MHTLLWVQSQSEGFLLALSCTTLTEGQRKKSQNIPLTLFNAFLEFFPQQCVETSLLYFWTSIKELLSMGDCQNQCSMREWQQRIPPLPPCRCYQKAFWLHSSVQFSSVAQSCPTLCDPKNRSTPGLPVHHQLPEFTQTHVHRVGDAIQSSHPLSSPSPPAPNPSQHQSLFQWVNSLHEVAKELEFQL